MSTVAGTDRPRTKRQRVPVKTMVAVVGSVLLTYLGIQLLIRLQHVVVWAVVSGFFAAVLHPAVECLVRWLRLKRGLAVLVVFLVGSGLVAGLGYLFVRPLVDQVNVAINQFPAYVADAKAGRGAIGHLVKRYHLDSYVERNQPNLKNALQAAGKPAVQVATGFLSTLADLATIIVMTFLFLLEGPRMMAGGLAILSPPAAEKAATVARDVVRALAGYMGGVLATSILAGAVAYAALWALGIPFRGVLALWIGFTALIPIVGVVIGVLPAAAVGFIHSTAAGIGITVLLLGYHLVENRTLVKRINARTLALSPLAIAVSVLVGLQLLGWLGALLAIPAAGVLHVVVRDLWAFRHPSRLPSPLSGTGLASAGAAGSGAAGAGSGSVSPGSGPAE
jgi:predicted PurR-regulated permease PerM